MGSQQALRLRPVLCCGCSCIAALPWVDLPSWHHACSMIHAHAHAYTCLFTFAAGSAQALQTNLRRVYKGNLVPAEALSNVSGIVASSIAPGPHMLERRLEVASQLRGLGGWCDDDAAWAQHMQDTVKAAKQVLDNEDPRAWLALPPVAALCLAMADQPGCATTALWPDQQGDSRHGQCLEACLLALVENSDLGPSMINRKVEDPDKQLQEKEMWVKGWVVGLLLVDPSAEVAAGGQPEQRIDHALLPKQHHLEGRSRQAGALLKKARR